MILAIPICIYVVSNYAQVCPVRVSSMPNSTLPDIETLNAAKAFLRRGSSRREPFFLAVGFQKPHIPLKYPRRFLSNSLEFSLIDFVQFLLLYTSIIVQKYEFAEYHPLNKFAVPKNYEWPLNVSSVAYNPWTDLRRRSDVERLELECPWGKIPSNNNTNFCIQKINLL